MKKTKGKFNKEAQKDIAEECGVIASPSTSSKIECSAKRS